MKLAKVHMRTEKKSISINFKPIEESNHFFFETEAKALPHLLIKKKVLSF
jgi:hypothetical protein